MKDVRSPETSLYTREPACGLASVARTTSPKKPPNTSHNDKDKAETPTANHFSAGATQ
jgi:hypothetical protein